MFVSVENVGKTAANTIDIRFSPQLDVPKSARDPDSQATEFFRQGVDRTISTIAPGARFLFLLDADNEISEHLGQGTLIRKTTATVTYKDIYGNQYSDQYVLDIGDWVFSAAEHDALTDVAKSLSAIQKKGLKVEDISH